jgi:maleate isomerase
MAFNSWRGTVGYIKPSYRPGGLEELIRMLPDGIGFIPLFQNVRRGALDEFKTMIPAYEAKVAELAEIGVDLIHPGGAPPFMMLGYKGEQKLIEEWEKRYKIPTFTAGMGQVDALNALKVKRFLGATYFRGDINQIFAKYFAEAGFTVLDMAGMDVDFDKAQELSSQQVYRFIKAAFRANPTAEAIYMLGSGWRTLDIIETLEQDLGIPVVHAVPAECWDIQRRLKVRQPIAGFGRLVAELPA